MRSTFFWLLSFGGLAAVSLLCGLLVWPQLSAAWPSIEEKIDLFRRLPPLAKLVLVLFVGAFVVYGSTKTNQVDQTSGTNIVEIVEGSETNDVDQVSGTNEVGLGKVEAAPPPLGLNGEFRFLTSGEGAPRIAPASQLASLGGYASTLGAASTLAVTEEDIARGWQLCEVRTNCNISYTMPEGATLATNWWVRGAFEDCSIVRLGDCLIGGGTVQSNNQNNPNNQTMSFPFGTNEYDSVWAFTWGKLRFELGNTNTEIVAVGAPMSAVPYRSRLWSAVDTNGARVVTWENFVLGRALKEDVDSLTSGEAPLPLCCAQIELRSTGDFIVRSNEVETVYRRVDPEDWDGDGWKNEDDPDPYVWDEFCEMFNPELPEGANEDAYCWVDIRPQWNSEIVFYGDAPSNLDDPYVCGKAGETYRVRLLIGKDYVVESTQPFDVLAKSDERIEVTEFGVNQAEVIWPVTFTVAEGRAPTGRPRLGATWNDGGKSFYVMPNPPWLRGAVTWTNDFCCGVWGDGTNFTYACDNTCHCEGCTVYGNYWYEGYRLPVWGIPCGCHYVPDHGPVGVSISFDRSAVIYEDAYTNQPGEVVHPARSNAVLRCSVYGGTYGGTLSVTLNAAAQQKLSKVSGDTLPQNARIEPDTSRSYEVVYSVLEPSGSVGDIGAEAVFLEDFLNETHSDDASMTAVKVELEAVYEAPENPNQSRHVYGVGEKVRFKVTPVASDGTLNVVKADVTDNITEYDTFEGILGVALSAENLYQCPATDTRPDVTLRYQGVEYKPSMTVVEPQSVEALSVSHEGTFWPGDVCMGVMVSRVYVKPYTVSFSGVHIYEVPCTNAIPPSGYFASEYYNGPKTHVYPNAGYLHIPDAENYVMTDLAGRDVAYTNWFAGTLTWKVPIGWRRILRGYENLLAAHEVDHARLRDEYSRPLLIGGSEDAYTQTFEIETDGTSSIRKFGYKLQRSRWLPFGFVSQTGDD